MSRWLHFCHFHYACSYPYLYTYIYDFSKCLGIHLPTLASGIDLTDVLWAHWRNNQQEERLSCLTQQPSCWSTYLHFVRYGFIYLFNLFYDRDFNAEPSRGVAEACCVGYSESWCFLTVPLLCVKQSLSLGILPEMGFQKSHTVPCWLLTSLILPLCDTSSKCLSGGWKWVCW